MGLTMETMPSATAPTTTDNPAMASGGIATANKLGGLKTTLSTTKTLAGPAMTLATALTLLVALALPTAVNTTLLDTSGAAMKHLEAPASMSTSYHDGNFDLTTMSGSQ